MKRFAKAALAGILALVGTSCSKVRVAVPAPPNLAFQTATIAAHGPAHGNPYTEFLSDGSFSAQAPLIDVIGAAYDVPYPGLTRVLIQDGPEWVRSGDEWYDIEATPGKGLPPWLSITERRERMRLMLQRLLAERFALAIRIRTQSMPAFSVVVAKGGPKLQTANLVERDCTDHSGNPEVDCHRFWGGQGQGLHARAASIKDLARFVENWTDRPLVDKTGLKGLYRFETEGWLPMTLQSRPAAGSAKAEDGKDMADVPSVFAVFRRLGLQLKSERAEATVYEIAHVEQPMER